MPSPNGMNGVQPKIEKPLEKRFDHTYLQVALLATYDLMTRGLLQYEFIVVGEAAGCIKADKPLSGTGIDCVIENKRITPAVVAMIKEWATADVTSDGFVFHVGEVPVRFKFVKNKYDYFTYADIRIYGAEQYKIPNQFDEYWKHREEIV